MNLPSTSAARTTYRDGTIVLIATMTSAIAGLFAARYSSVVADGAACALLPGVLLARSPDVMFGVRFLSLRYGPEPLAGGPRTFAQLQLRKGLLLLVLAAFSIGLGVLSYTDDTLRSWHLHASSCWVVGILAAASTRPIRPPQTTPRVARANLAAVLQSVG